MLVFREFIKINIIHEQEEQCENISWKKTIFSIHFSNDRYLYQNISTNNLLLSILTILKRVSQDGSSRHLGRHEYRWMVMTDICRQGQQWTDMNGHRQKWAAIHRTFSFYCNSVFPYKKVNRSIVNHNI